MQFGRSEEVTARDIMVPRSRLVVLHPNMDALGAVQMLVKKKISGAPVVDGENRYLGVFSEKNAMEFLLRLNYDSLPSNDVGYFMNPSLDRTISAATDLLAVIEIFQKTPFRRLPVLTGEHLVGQVSRRDVLASTTSRLTVKRTSHAAHASGTLYLSATGAARDLLRK